MKPHAETLSAETSNRSTSVGGAPSFDVRAFRGQFPILRERFNNKPLIYLDNAATTQKPLAVIEASDRYYRSENSNIHRGVYTLSQLATDLYERARRTIAQFINAEQTKQVLFTRGTTESINLVAQTFGRASIGRGDEILISGLEHHSNIVPWQMLCQQSGATLKVIPLDDRGQLQMEEFANLLSQRTKLVAVAHVSNSLGTMNPVRQIIRQAHAVGAKVLLDGAQWIAHGKTDVRELECDFYAFSGHKIYGPTGIGVLYGKLDLLEAMPPWQGGGDMIRSVTFAKTEYADLPHKFEAGTPNIAGGIALGTAIEWLQQQDIEALAKYECELLAYATKKVERVPGLTIIGTAEHKATVISFRMHRPEGTEIGSHDIGTMLDMEGIAIRTGHHCCQPVMDRFGIASTARASLAAYNTREEVDQLVTSLEKIAASEATRKTAPARGKSAKVQAANPAGVLDEAFVKAASSGPSPSAVADEIAETLEFFEDRNAKSEFIMNDLGGKLPNIFDDLKALGIPRVQGCMSEVYLLGRPAKSDRHVVEFIADANAEIVRGLIAVLQRLFSGQKARDILEFDIEGFFRRIGLDSFITTQRRNGLAGMVKRIRELAERTATAEKA